jgi:arylsulfatase
MDIMPTCLNVANMRYPSIYKGYSTTPLEGQSLLPILLGETGEPRPIFWEHEGNRAVRDGKWKLVSRHPGDWELYDMEADRTEMNDLALQHPEIVQRMERMYDQWAKRSNVLAWPK